MCVYIYIFSFKLKTSLIVDNTNVWFIRQTTDSVGTGGPWPGTGVRNRTALPPERAMGTACGPGVDVLHEMPTPVLRLRDEPVVVVELVCNNNPIIIDGNQFNIKKKKFKRNLL